MRFKYRIKIKLIKEKRIYSLRDRSSAHRIFGNDYRFTNGNDYRLAPSLLSRTSGGEVDIINGQYGDCVGESKFYFHIVSLFFILIYSFDVSLLSWFLLNDLPLIYQITNRFHLSP